MQPFLKLPLKHFILIEGKQQWFPSHYPQIVSICTEKILTTKSHPCMGAHAFKIPPHQSHAVKMQLMVCCSECDEKASDHVLASNAASVLYMARLWPIKFQAICLKLFFAWHALPCVPTLLFVLNECQGNGLIMLTCW